MAKQLTVLERIENLERAEENSSNKLDEAFNQLRGQLSSAMEVVESVVAVLGEVTPDLEKRVDAKMKEKREARKAAKVAQEAKQVVQMVEMGVIKPAATINSNSFIVGRTLNKEGELVGTGREQFEFGQLHPSIQGSFLGKEVGYVFEAQGSRLEVLEVYDIVPQNEVKTSTLDASLNPAPVTPPASVSTES